VFRCGQDCGTDRIETLHDFNVPKSDYFVALIRKPGIASAVVVRSRRMAMLSAIHFDNQLFLRAKEVNSIRPDWRLAPEAQAFNSRLTELEPEP
jgi:hypothetical protein